VGGSQWKLGSRSAATTRAALTTQKAAFRLDQTPTSAAPAPTQPFPNLHFCPFRLAWASLATRFLPGVPGCAGDRRRRVEPGKGTSPSILIAALDPVAHSAAPSRATARPNPPRPSILARRPGETHETLPPTAFPDPVAFFFLLLIPLRPCLDDKEGSHSISRPRPPFAASLGAAALLSRFDGPCGSIGFCPWSSPDGASEVLIFSPSPSRQPASSARSPVSGPSQAAAQQSGRNSQDKEPPTSAIREVRWFPIAAGLGRSRPRIAWALVLCFALRLDAWPAWHRIPPHFSLSAHSTRPGSDGPSQPRPAAPLTFFSSRRATERAPRFRGVPSTKGFMRAASRTARASS